MMTEEIDIRVAGLGKMYRIGLAEKRNATLAGHAKQFLGAPFKYLRTKLSSITEQETLWALKDVSFEVRRGEVLGIIGRNGSGKSTLLKILSRITDPTEGDAWIRGRVNSLLEVGTGFHPELTGRENIYMNAAMHGMTRREIQSKMDEIIDFSGVERFLDTPVKRYSSGMYTRLAFAVAAHLDPDVLLVDEVLAVGDAAFQRKCIGKMNESAKAGRTVVVVSHNMPVVLNLCTRGVVLSDGCVQFDGAIREAVDLYSAVSTSENLFCPAKENRSGNGRVRVTDIILRPAPPRSLEPLEIELHLECLAADLPLDVDVSIGIRHQYDIALVNIQSTHVRQSLRLTKSKACVSMSVDALPLSAGQYRVNVWVGTGSDPMDWLQDAIPLSVETGCYGASDFYVTSNYPVILPARWAVRDL